MNKIGALNEVSNPIGCILELGIFAGRLNMPDESVSRWGREVFQFIKALSGIDKFIDN